MRRRKKTPIRAALVDSSPLHDEVEDGLGAMKKAHRSFVADDVRADFADSIDLDEAMRPGREDQNRWDYLLGHGASGEVIGLEPHSAKHDEISVVIAKKRAAMDQARPHLTPGAKVSAWLWVASGKVHFADTEKARRRLDQNGIQFVGTKVMRKDLAAVAPVAKKPKS